MVQLPLLSILKIKNSIFASINLIDKTKKMKKVLMIIAFVGLGLVSCKNEKKDKTETKAETAATQKNEAETAINQKNETASTDVQAGNIDVATSVVTWKGTKPTGAHNGTVSLKSGNLVTEDGKLKSGEFLIDMNSIKALDLKDADDKEKLEGHLKADDFFNVAKYPTSKFVITSVEEKDGKLVVTGDLTVKTTTKPITVPATVSETDGVITFKSDNFKINRTDFDIKYKSKSFFNDLKDKFIDDMIEFSFDVKSKK